MTKKIKKISLFFLLCCFYSFSFAAGLNFSLAECAKALPTNDPNFCSSFRTRAICYCKQSLPEGMCQDMKTNYERMISLDGTLEKSCKKRDKADPETCIDSWNCYRNGGANTKGKCSGTGNKCA